MTVETLNLRIKCFSVERIRCKYVFCQGYKSEVVKLAHDAGAFQAGGHHSSCYC